MNAFPISKARSAGCCLAPTGGAHRHLHGCPAARLNPPTAGRGRRRGTAGRGARQLEEYFAGTRREFDLPLRLQGTEFQQRVWRN